MTPAHANHFLVLSILVLATILLTVGLRSFVGLRTARLRFAGESAFRDLATQSTAAQSTGAAALGALQVDMSEMKTRLASLETLLREVG